MERQLLRLTPFRERSGLTEDQLFESLDRVLNKYFGRQGPKVIAENLAVARHGYLEVMEVLTPAGENVSENAHESLWHCESAACAGDGCLVSPEFCERVVESYTHGRETELPADIYAARS